MKVAVLTGGSSTERELSLASAKNVCAALEEAGHRTVLLDASSDLVSALRVERPDVCFNALHGKLGEDGTVQMSRRLPGRRASASRARRSRAWALRRRLTWWKTA